MLNQMTLNRLHEMKLSAMAEKYRTIAASAAEGQLSFDEWFGLLVDAEWDHRHTNRIARLMKKATLYFPKRILSTALTESSTGISCRSWVLAGTSWTSAM